MGFGSSKQKKYQNSVTVWYLNRDGSFQMPTSSTLKQLNSQLNKYNSNKKYIYFHWNLLSDKDENKSLEQIINEEITTNPHNKERNQIFIVIQDEANLKSQQKKKVELNLMKNDKIYNKLSKIQQINLNQQYPENFTIGKGGKMLFQGRESALLASAVSYALKKSNVSQQKINQITKQIIDKHHEEKGMSLIGKFFQSIGLAKKNQSLENEETLKKIKSSINQFTDFDPKFIYYIQEIYLKFMIKSLGKIHYINYQKLTDFDVASIPNNSKIGIMGDFGTGLKDSIELLKNMIQNHDVNIILHLGDVYYAGTPEQYEISITKPLHQLRVLAKREIRFYSIPGNHDYYSWGLPFLCFVKNINSNQFQRQKASYFCLRDYQNKWQILGMDTAFYDSNPLNQIDPSGMGPHLKKQQILWHKYRLQNFQGSTILLSHHQLFSIHQRINGQINKYRNFSCLNPMLNAQLFEFIPQISAWFWGHQHSFMLFKQKILGLQKGRLLGNSSFHVLFQKQDPYSRNKGYPHIPLIVQDEQYKKYIPKNPNITKQTFYSLTYAVINMQKMDSQNNLPIQYWCSPCYSNEEIQKINELSEEQRKSVYFNQYKIYEQVILSRSSIAKNSLLIKSHDKIYLRCEIGLCLAYQQPSEKINQNIKKVTKQVENSSITQQKDVKQQQVQNKQTQKQRVHKNLRSQPDKDVALSPKEQKKQTKLQKSNDPKLCLNLQGTQFQYQQLNIISSITVQFSLSLLNKNAKRLYLCISQQERKLHLRQINNTQELSQYNGIWILQKYKSLIPSTNQKWGELYNNDIIKIKNKKIANEYLGWDIEYFQAYPKLQKLQKQQEQLLHEQQKVNDSSTNNINSIKKQSICPLWAISLENVIKK